MDRAPTRACVAERVSDESKEESRENSKQKLAHARRELGWEGGLQCTFMRAGAGAGLLSAFGVWLGCKLAQHWGHWKPTQSSAWIRM